MFSKEDKYHIKSLCELKGYSARRLIHEFPMKRQRLSSLNYLIKKIDETGSVDRRSGSGRPRTAWVSSKISQVEELVLSQDDKPQSHQSLRQITRETGMSLTSVHRIVKRDLSLICVKWTRPQELTAANKAARLARCRKLLHLYPPEMVQMMWFTDEKLFSVTASLNKQNNRCCVESTKEKKEVDTARLLRTRPTYSKLLMVSVGVSCLGCTDVHF